MGPREANSLATSGAGRLALKNLTRKHAACACVLVEHTVGIALEMTRTEKPSEPNGTIPYVAQALGGIYLWSCLITGISSPRNREVDDLVQGNAKQDAKGNVPVVAPTCGFASACSRNGFLSFRWYLCIIEHTGDHDNQDALGKESFVAIIMMALHPRLAGYSPVRPYTENNGDAHQKLLLYAWVLGPGVTLSLLTPHQPNHQNPNKLSAADLVYELNGTDKDPL
ncbi:hypothetical protein BJV77DRAFT_1147851 [Russula vinacea]|nr:hypothetical protein BJV77DRAFT_1147851 [Russula vinacea]